MEYGDFFNTVKPDLGALVQDMQIPLDNIKDYDQVKGKLTVQLVGREGNEEKLSRIPHYDLEDLSLVYHIEMGWADGGWNSFLVTNEMMHGYGVSAEQLHQDALKSAQRRQPFFLRSLNEIVAEILEVEVSDLGGSSDLCVATNSARKNGAGVIAYPGFMDTVAKKMKGDFFILPSSIHEVMLMPDNGLLTYQEMEAIVSEVNEMQLSPEERLTNRVYHYDCQEKVFELAEKFDARARRKEDERPSVLKSLEEHKANTVPRKSRLLDSRTEPALIV